MDRSLHGLIVALVRQLGIEAKEAKTPDPFPLRHGGELRLRIEDIIRTRVRAIAPGEEAAVTKKFLRRLEQWNAWNPAEYGDFGKTPQDPPLMHPAGSTELPQWGGRSWATMSSLRNVDATCEADLTAEYNTLPGEAS